MVSYEIGGVVGGHSNNISSHHGSSSFLAPGTTLPSGIIVSTEVPQSLVTPDSPHALLAVPTISFTPSESPVLDNSSSLVDPMGQAVHTVEEHQGHEDSDGGGVDGGGDAGKDGEGEEGEYDLTGGDEDKYDVYMQKGHVAVYEINARWGSRLMMVLVTLGGLVSVLGGGLCAEHHCKDLQFCQEDHQAHGNWCGPSGKWAQSPNACFS